jgi:hypothetical protein
MSTVCLENWQIDRHINVHRHSKTVADYMYSKADKQKDLKKTVK